MPANLIFFVGSPGFTHNTKWNGFVYWVAITSAASAFARIFDIITIM